MKRIFQTLFFLVFSAFIYAQPPQAIQYQAVVRNAEGELVTHQRVSYEISIKSGSVDGTTEYAETHIDTTSEKGLSTLMIGTGTPVVGTFSSIDWSDNDYAEVSISMDGGATWTQLSHWEENHPSTVGESEAVTVDLTPYAGSIMTQLRFHYVAPDWEYFWIIDDVTVTRN